MGRLDHDRTDGLIGLDGKKLQSTPANPVSFGEELQYWVDKEGQAPRFSYIAAMYSELIAVNITGQLCQWRWADPEPFVGTESTGGPVFHPKAQALGLSGSEKFVGLAACSVRASAWTESGKVVTWVDETLNSVASKLEHPAQTFTEFQSEKIVSLHTCWMFTCARMESGSLYWWGIVPFGQRKRNLEKMRTRGRKNKQMEAKKCTGDHVWNPGVPSKFANLSDRRSRIYSDERWCAKGRTVDEGSLVVD